jgi:hypothetical protein
MLATMLDHFGDRFNFAIAANGDIDRDRTIAAQGVAECQGLVMNGPFARGEIGNHHDKRKPKERLCLASYRFPLRINFLAPRALFRRGIMIGTAITRAIRQPKKAMRNSRPGGNTRMARSPGCAISPSRAASACEASCNW